MTTTPTHLANLPCAHLPLKRTPGSAGRGMELLRDENPGAREDAAGGTGGGGGHIGVAQIDVPKWHRGKWRRLKPA